MARRHCALLIGATALLLSAHCGHAAEPFRSVISLNGDWSLSVTRAADPPSIDGDWRTVAVPSLESSDAVGGSRYAWYRRQVTVPEEWDGRRLFLRLVGARYAPRVYIDDTFVGSQLDGWTPYEVEITDHVGPDREAIVIVGCQDWAAVFADGLELTEPGTVQELRYDPRVMGKLMAPIGGHWRAHGLWDDAELLCRPRQAFLDDIAIAPSVRRGTLTVSGAVRGQADDGAQVDAEVLDGDSVALRLPAVAIGADGRWRLSAAFADARFWSPEDPHLYHLRVRLRGPQADTLADEVTERFGFRELWAEGPDFYFNGVKRHLLASSGWPVVRNQTDAEVRQSLVTMRESNCVAFRLHTQPWQRKWLKHADEVGMMIIEEGALWCDSAYAYTNPVLWRNIKDHIAGMIRRDRNHASLVMWSIENELLHCGAERYDPNVEAKLADVGRSAKALDPTHLIMFEADLDPGGVADVIGLHYPHEMPEHTDYPNTADWMDRTVKTGTGGGLLGSRRKDFHWERDKPLYIGEFLWVPSGNFAPGTVFFGEDAYLNRRLYHVEAQALSWRYQIWAYRRAGVSGMVPWTFAGSGGHADVNHPFYREQKSAYEPIAARARERDTRFYAGTTLERSFDVFNDSTRKRRLILRVSVGEQTQAGEAVELEPAGHRELKFTFALPTTETEKSLPIVHVLQSDGQDVHRVEIPGRLFPRQAARVPRGFDVVVYAPNQPWQPGFPLRRIETLRAAASLDPARTVLVIAANALRPSTVSGEMPEIGHPPAGGAQVVAFLRRGGRMLVLEQTTLDPLPLGVTLVPQASTWTFPQDNGQAVTAGLTAADLRLWRGDHYVSRFELLRPTASGARTLVVSGSAQQLAQGPVVEIRAGAGTALFCQALVGEKLDTEPVAARLLENCLAHLAEAGNSPQEGGRTLVLADPTTGFADHLRQLGITVAEPTDGRFPAVAASLLVLHGDSIEAGPLRQFLDDGSPGKTVYWHAPSPEAFEELKHELGAGALTLIPSQGPITKEDGKHDLFLGVSREELYYVGDPDGSSWRAPVAPDPTMVDFCLAPTAERSGDLRRFEAEDMTIDGQIVSEHEDPPGVVFATAGSATTSLAVTEPGLYRAVIVAGGTPLEKVYPRVQLAVDGRVAAEVQLSAPEFREYATVVRLAAGDHALAAAFVNDQRRGGEDRNLYLDAILVDTSPFLRSGVLFLTLPPAVGVIDTAAAAGRPGFRLVIDTIRWDRASRNRARAARYASALLANLGASFHAPDPEPEWIRPRSLEAVGDIPYFSKSDKQVNLVAAGTIAADFSCRETGTYDVVVRGHSAPADGVFATARVTIDDRDVGEVELTAPSSESFPVGTVAVSAGDHRLTLAYTNDLYRDGADRNLYVNAVGFRKRAAGR